MSAGTPALTTLRSRLVFALFLLLAWPLHAAGAAKSIVFTHVPAFGQSADKNLSGRIYGIDPATVRIALYIQVENTWWTKPSEATPLTTVAANGTWSANIAPVGSDTVATEIAALVVPVGYNPSPVLGDLWLPDSITQAALASTFIIRPDPSRRNIHWAGLDWHVYDSAGLRVGPNDNLFSASTNNLFVDAAGLLHLRITGSGTTWNCAALTAYRTLGLGRYIIRTVTACDTLDGNAVLGLFTWSDSDTDPNFREIDIEWSRWGDPADKTNAQFVVQPYEPAGHLKRITVPAATGELTQEFNWRADGVDFLATATGYASSWSYPPAGTTSLNLPASRDEKINFNLWLNDTTGPRSGQPVEVILRSFSFQGTDTDGDGMPDDWERAHGLEPASSTDAARDDDGDGATNLAECLADTEPADPASIFRITQYVRTATTQELTFTARPDKLYDIESSATLASDSWIPVVSGLSSASATITTPLPDPGAAGRTFYRVRVRGTP